MDPVFQTLPRLPLPSIKLPACLLALPLVCRASPLIVGGTGQYQDLQQAIEACPATECDIVLTDSVYQLPREIWISNKSSFRLRRSDGLRTTGIRPRLHFAAGFDPFSVKGTPIDSLDAERPSGWLKWPASSTTSIGGSANTTNPHSPTGYLYNGMIVVANSRDVSLEGLRLDGTQPRTFVNTAAWNGMYDLIHGNVGIDLFQSLRVRILESEISGFYTGVFSYGHNPLGRTALNPNDDCTDPPIPLAFPEAVGDHVIERNLLHDNIWAIRSQKETDLGSTIRFNLAWNNLNRSWSTLKAASPTEGGNQAGGFIHLQQVPTTIHRIHNNTIMGSPLILGTSAFQAGVQHLFYNNIVGGFDAIHGSPTREMVADYRQNLRYHGFWLEHDLFEVGTTDSLYATRIHAQGQLDDSAACAWTSSGNPSCWVTWESPVTTRSLKSWLWNGWTIASGMTYEAKYGGKTYTVRDANGNQEGPIAKINGYAARSWDLLPTELNWVSEIAWKSTTPGSIDRFVPDWSAPSTRRFIQGRASPASGWLDATGSPPDLGAKQKTESVDILSWRSQESVTTSDNTCFSIPLRRLSGPRIASGRIVAVSAWEKLLYDRDNLAETDPKPLGVKALADSTLPIDGSSVSVCLESAFVASRPAPHSLRFQLEISGTTEANGTTIRSEPAYFLWIAPELLWPANGTSVRRTPTLPTRRIGDRWVARVPGDALYEVRIFRPDGRTLWSKSIRSISGNLSIPVPELADQQLFLQIRNGSERLEAAIPRAEGGAPSMPGHRPAARKACGG